MILDTRMISRTLIFYKLSVQHKKLEFDIVITILFK
jgi:hypothetical protein